MSSGKMSRSRMGGVLQVEDLLSARTLTSLITLVALTTATGWARQTPPAASTGAITGVVSDVLTGAPLADALVYLSAKGRGSTQMRQLTDEKGRFAFVNLAANPSYTIAASRIGYLDGGFLQDG